MPDFPQFDPETLAQAIRTFVISRQNVNALQNGGSANYDEVIAGWADALAAVQNPSFEQLQINDDALFAIVGQSSSGAVTLLFNTQGVVTVGQFVYQFSNDTVAASDFGAAATGSVIGIVTELPTQSTARVQSTGSYTFSPNDPFSFLPMIPDQMYYAGASGEIVASPSPASGGYLQEVGYAKTAYEFVFNIQEYTLV